MNEAVSYYPAWTGTAGHRSQEADHADHATAAARQAIDAGEIPSDTKKSPQIC